MFSQIPEGTNLSAEVPPFVPRRTRIDDGSHPSSSQLPRYLTTCFPFVQEQQDRRLLAGSPNVPSFPFNQPPPWPPQLYASAMFGQFNRPFNIGMLRANDTTGNIADSSQSDAVGSASAQTSRSSQKQSNRSSSSKVEDKQKPRKVTKKNVGVQKEVGGERSEEESAPKMTDSGQQTDFPSNIASKSLTDKPSPLKKLRNRRSKVNPAQEGHGSSSDPADADVDSDSGYYSPKRRLNPKKNNGNTADAASMAQAINPLHSVMFLPPGNIPPSMLFAAPHSPPSQLPSHATPPPNPGNLLGYVPPEGPLMVNPPPASLINPASITSRPPPGFPMPPSMLKPHASMQIPDGWMWNGAHAFLPNVPPPQVPFAQFQPPNSSTQAVNSYPANKKPPPQTHRNATSSNQGFPMKNRKHTPRNRSNRETTQPEHHYQSKMATSPQPDLNAALYLQDNTEFPGLGNSSFVQDADANNKLSYCQALTQKPRERIAPQQNAQPTSRPPSKSGDESNLDKNQKSRKRWKKEERATKAAAEEYAEISREQESIKKAIKKTASHRNRKQGNVLDLGDIFSKLEARGSSKSSGHRKVQIGGGVAPTGTRSLSAIHQKSRPAIRMGANPLDATAPSVRRGKERETPKAKKPSALKKVILKEREEKKEQRLQQLSTMDCPDHDVPPYPNAILNPVNPVASGASTEDEEPVVSSKMAHLTIDDVPSNVPQIHSRRYREYCCQVLDRKIDDTCTLILQKLVYFQDRMYQRDPVKAKMRRRLVMGIREVTKHLKLKKLKCVIISPNLEKIQSKGGLDDALQQILNLCQEQNITYIFALGRKAMGRAVSKLVPVSIVGIFDYSGVDDHYKQLVSLVSDAQHEYKEMVAVYQQEVIKANTPSVPVPSTSSKRFAHMTHSRNPSAASCISFASFISEPISEMNEDSNWRVLMDADEPPLPPTAEDDGSISEEDGGVEEVQDEGEPGKLSRKDSECTVVECKAAQEVYVEVTSDVAKPSSLDKLSSCGSSEYKDAKSQNSKQFQNFGDTSPDLTSPESEKSLPIPTLPVAEPGTPPEPSLPGESSTLTIDTMESSSSAQDRVQMWLEDSHCSIPTDKDDEIAELTTDEESSKDP